tara:strand:+ start:1202 stop:1729 length:528 start_codon:yes stop_codon:yes gene_type:complete
MSLKIKIKRVSGVPSTSDLESGEIGLNTSNNQLYVNIGGTITAVSGGGGGSVDLSAVAQDIVPDSDDARDLGSSSKKWAELHLSGSTIFLGNAKIKANSAGEITDKDDNKLAIANEEGAPIRMVPLFTASGGLTTPAKRLTFKANSARSLVYKDTFTKANGSSLSSTNATQLFEF